MEDTCLLTTLESCTEQQCINIVCNLTKDLLLLSYFDLRKLFEDKGYLAATHILVCIANIYGFGIPRLDAMKVYDHMVARKLRTESSEMGYKRRNELLLETMMAMLEQYQNEDECLKAIIHYSQSRHHQEVFPNINTNIFYQFPRAKEEYLRLRNISLSKGVPGENNNE